MTNNVVADSVNLANGQNLPDVTNVRHFETINLSPGICDAKSIHDIYYKANLARQTLQFHTSTEHLITTDDFSTEENDDSTPVVLGFMIFFCTVFVLFELILRLIIMCYDVESNIFAFFNILVAFDTTNYCFVFCHYT